MASGPGPGPVPTPLAPLRSKHAASAAEGRSSKVRAERLPSPPSSLLRQVQDAARDCDSELEGSRLLSGVRGEKARRKAFSKMANEMKGSLRGSLRAQQPQHKRGKEGGSGARRSSRRHAGGRPAQAPCQLCRRGTDKRVPRTQTKVRFSNHARVGGERVCAHRLHHQGPRGSLRTLGKVHWRAEEKGFAGAAVWGAAGGARQRGCPLQARGRGPRRRRAL